MENAVTQADRLFRVRTVSGFWDRAVEARARYEQVMGAPYDDDAASVRQCWDYWYVPANTSTCAPTRPSCWARP